MRNLFLLPLLLGTLPMLILSYVGFRYIGRLSFNLWNSGTAVLTMGFVVQGVIELSGRRTHYINYYLCIGGLFFVVSLIGVLAGLLIHRKEA